MNKYKVLIALLLSVSLVGTALPAFAATLDLWGDELTGTEGIGNNAFTDLGLGNRDPRKIAASVIQVILGFLGVIAVLLILFGGFKWMTAAGDESKVEDAQELIKAGVIGLLIILAAFAISVFVINALLASTGANATLNPQTT